MFTIADMLDETRAILNDDISPYRYDNALVEQFVRRGVNEIHRSRSDSRINDRGEIYSSENLFEYTASSYMDEYSRITGWDKIGMGTLYFGADSANTVRIYPTSADRTADTNHYAVINSTDEYGLKPVIAANDSGFGGSILVLSAIADTTAWDVEAQMLDIPLDDMFMRPLINFTVSRCFDIDAEDSSDAGLANKYYSMYKNEVMGL